MEDEIAFNTFPNNIASRWFQDLLTPPDTRPRGATAAVVGFGLSSPNTVGNCVYATLAVRRMEPSVTAHLKKA